jgi:hypothetical protein
LLKTLLLAFLLQSPPQALNPSSPVQPCTSCSYTDTSVQDGVTYTYFVEAYDPTYTSPYSATSNPAVAVIPATGTHSVALQWTGSTDTGAAYFVFRTSPPVNLQIQSEQ